MRSGPIRFWPNGSAAMPPTFDETAQHCVHATLPSPSPALEECEYVSIEAHGDLKLVFRWSLHEVGRCVCAAHPIGGHPVPCRIACHVGGQLLFGFCANGFPIRSVLAAGFHRGELLIRVFHD